MQHFINRIFLLFSLLISAVTLAQPSVDTLDTPKGKLILHEDQTWSIATDPSFNGILNPRIHAIVNSYTVPFKQAWRKCGLHRKGK